MPNPSGPFSNDPPNPSHSPKRGAKDFKSVASCYNDLVMKPRKARVLKYTAIFEPEKVGGYSVTIPALPGCVSEGDTFEEALKNIKEAAELYLEDLKESEIPEETKPIVVSPINVRL